MQLTKEQLIDAHEQGLNINTRNGNIKIVTILGDVYGVNHCDTNSKLVKWWMFENFERNQATIKQPKPKIDLSILKEGEIYYVECYKSKYITIFKSIYNNTDNSIYGSAFYTLDNDITTNESGLFINITELRLPTESELELFYSKFPELKPKKYNGRAVKCDTVEQLEWYCKHKNFEYNYSVLIMLVNDSKNIGIKDNSVYTDDYAKELNYEIISFSQYCTENGINEPKWIQGFEVKDGYNDVIFVSDSHLSINTSFPNVSMRILKEVREHNEYPFKMHDNSMFAYARYPQKNEINAIKFVG